jgi:hypothetical protein
MGRAMRVATWVGLALAVAGGPVLAQGSAAGSAPAGAMPLGLAPQGPAAAVSPPPSEPGPPTTSLQNQLGAIPLMSPQARAQASTMRKVRLTQLDGDRKPLGAARELDCPETGCQHVVALAMDQEQLPFLAQIQFVGQGAYFTLEPRSIAVGAVREFSSGRAGPVFLKASPNRGVDKQVRFVAAPPESLRRLDGAQGSQTVSAGQRVTRKRAPDVILQVEILPPPAG